MFTRRTVLLAALSVVILVAGATWAFAQNSANVIHACVNNSSGTIKIVAAGASCGSNEIAVNWLTGDAPVGGGGAAVFAWGGRPWPERDICFGFVGGRVSTNCDSPNVQSGALLIPSDGELTAMAIKPLINTYVRDVKHAVLINGQESALSIVVPAGSTAFLTNSASVAVQAGDLVLVKTFASFDPEEPIPTVPYPDPRPYPGGLPMEFEFLGSMEYHSQ